MKRSTLLLLTLLTALAAIPAAAQVNDTYIIAAASNNPGAFGTRWKTQFSVFNPQRYPLTITVVFLPTGGGEGLEEAFTVPANSVRYSDNILADLFGLSSGSGSLLVATFQDENPGVPDDVISRAFLVTSNTFNDDPRGTYGQTIPGVWAGLQDYDTDGISAIAHNIRNVGSLGWRTNIGAVNLGRDSVTMWVTIFNSEGELVEQAPFGIPPFAHMTQALPIQIDRASVEFTIDDPFGEAVVFPYAAVIDQLSGDSTYHSPTLTAPPSAIYGKKAVEPTAIGKKIDRKLAAEIRANARPRGVMRSLHSR